MKLSPFRFYVVVSISLLCYSYNFGQGCSDPGLCTTGTLNSGGMKDTVSSIDYTQADLSSLLNVSVASERYNFGIGGLYAVGDKKTAITNIIFNASVRLRNKTVLGIKLPYYFINGNLGSLNKLGDINLNLQNTFRSGNNVLLAYTLGLIIPVNNANNMIDGKALPMVYQTSLGVFNALAGLSLKYKKWSFAAGYQQSFGSNENNFTTEGLVFKPGAVGYDALNSIRETYVSSRNLKRGNDIMIRIEKGFGTKKLQAFFGILPIFRLNPSMIEKNSGEKIIISGTNGLTLNLTFGGAYQLKNDFILKLNFGGPAVTRKVKEDGLNRSYVLIIGVTKKVW